MKIAEIGLNHNGDEKYAIKLIDEIFKHEVDAITFQIRENSFYKGKFAKYLLKDNFYQKIKKKCKSKGIKIGFAICDDSKLDFIEKLKIDFIKIIRDGIKNKNLIKKILNTKVEKIFVSTGLANTNNIINFFNSVDKKNKKKIVLVHTQLNNKIENTNLKSINFLKQKFKCDVGFGNHCNNINVLYLSLAFNPYCIFFYVKSGAKKNFLDNHHAIDIKNLKIILNNVKLYKKAFGTYSKKNIYKNLNL